MPFVWRSSSRGSRFCPSCGAALTKAAAPEEMLKLVTILFADVVGSTARAEKLHPEDVRALMSDYFAAMAELPIPRAAHPPAIRTARARRR